MRRFGSTFRWVFVLLLLSCGAAMAAKQGLPVIGGKKAVATVNGEPISLEEFQRVLASLHEGAGEKQAGGARNYSDLLQRMINGRLILQEARNIGLDTLPEFRETVGLFGKQALRQILLARQVKDVRPDETEVDKVYRDSIREYRIRSYRFAKEEDAKQAEGDLRAGSGFDNVVNRMVSEGKATGSGEGGEVRGKDLLPEIAQAVSQMKVGEVSPALKVSTGRMGEATWTILLLEGIRYPENPQAKEQAGREVLKEARLAAIKKYVETLKKKYVKIHKDTLDGLDYEAKEPGIEKLLADPRAVAEIRGEKPVRVEELSRAVQGKFYHGVQQLATKKVNRQVPEVLNEMVTTRVLVKEALRKKIDKTPEYKQKVKEFEDEILFGLFVQKVINPDIRVEEEAARKYYEEHPAEFSAPEEIRGEDLAFSAREDAVDALEKLRRGGDFRWVNDNAPGQVEGKSRQRLFPAGGGHSTPLHDLPEGAREALSGAGSGEYRLYTSPEGQFLVLHILEAVPSKPYPFDAAKGKIQEKIFREEQQRSVEEWTGKLREASEIKVFATDREMEKVFGPAGGAAGKQ